MRGVPACRPVRALDTVPPPAWRQQLSRKVDSTVAFGTAEDLAGGNCHERTLLLCMPSPGEPGIAEQALQAFRGTRVLYVGEWQSGMTGTRALHEMLRREYRLVQTVLLPGSPLARLALHAFRRKAQARKSSEASSVEQAAPEGACCAHCGSAEGLRACPWTRRFLLCSPACHEAAAEAHAAEIRLTFCTAVPMTGSRPPFSAFEACKHLELATATDAEWLRLAQATPQPEREVPD